MINPSLSQMIRTIISITNDSHNRTLPHGANLADDVRFPVTYLKNLHH